MSSYSISTDPQRLDFDWVLRSLQTTYWANDRPREIMLTAIAHSLCFGLYEEETDQQVGFARVVTDHATMSWLCDVFVDPAHRSTGLGKRLMAEIVAHPQVARTRVYLATKDAHGLYEQFGFKRWEVMRRDRPPYAVGS
jgi:GNAT superfamily N-acetyltransferase